MKRLLPLLFLLPSLAWSAAATITSITQSQQTSNSVTDQAFTMPATLESGDLVIAMMTLDDGGDDDTITWDNVSAGTWTELYNLDGAAIVCAGFAIVSDGTEDGATVTPTSTNGEKSVTSVIRILAAEWEGTLATAVDVTTDNTAGSTTTPDPPSVTAGWGADDNLFIANAHMNAGGHTISAWSLPDNNNENDEGTTGGVLLLISSDENTGATLDPGTFTTDSSNTRCTSTIVVQPAAAAAAAVQMRRHMQ